MADPERGPAVYRYQDAEGRIHFVDEVDKIPGRFQPSAERVDLTRGSAWASESTRTVEYAPREEGIAGFARSIDPPSMGVGLAIGLVLAFLRSLVRGSGGWLIRAGLLAAVVVLLTGAYLGWLRRTAGKGEGFVATPAEMVEEARKAGLQLEQRLQHHKEMLERLDRGP